MISGQQQLSSCYSVESAGVLGLKLVVVSVVLCCVRVVDVLCLLVLCLCVVRVTNIIALHVRFVRRGALKIAIHRKPARIGWRPFAHSLITTIHFAILCEALGACGAQGRRSRKQRYELVCAV
jgi:hypothetical protein